MRRYRIGMLALGILMAVKLLGMPGDVWGQTVDIDDSPGTALVVEPRTYGIAADVAYTVSATEFDADFGSDPVTMFFSGTHLYKSSSGTAIVWAGVRLPAGALVTGVELEGCDDTGSIPVHFYSASSPNNLVAAKLLASAQIGDSVQLGCGLFPVPFEGGVTPADRTIDNAGRYYFLRVALVGSASFSNVRVFYQLQVSPAPALATFGDVPVGHPQRQYVEALAASGITAGCGGGNYCPDAPLTRGQMAVFLSKGLGLHFAP